MPTQTPILDPGVEADYSEPIVLEQGETVTVGIYSELDAHLAARYHFAVLAVTPGAESVIGALKANRREAQLSGPGTYRVERPELTGPAFGVYKVV